MDSFAWNLFKINIIGVSLYCGLCIVPWLQKKCVNWTKRNDINEAIFTKYVSCDVCSKRNGTLCETQYCYNYTLRKMKALIDGAQHSIFICMNIFTNPDLGEFVLDAHRRGVLVKIIVNGSTLDASGSQIRMLHSNG